MQSPCNRKELGTMGEPRTLQCPKESESNVAEGEARKIKQPSWRLQ